MRSTDKRRRIIFRPYFTRKGKKIWAKDYGLKAWPIPVSGNPKTGAR